MHSGVYSYIRPARIQSIGAELMGKLFTVEMEKDPQHIMKAIKDLGKANKWNGSQMAEMVSPIEHAFHNTVGREQLSEAAVQVNSSLGDVYGIKNDAYIYNC